MNNLLEDDFDTCPGYKTYVVLNQTTGVTKIGRSYNPLTRIKQLFNNTDDLNIISIINRDIEAILLRKYAFNKLYGEYFQLTEAQLYDIRVTYPSACTLTITLEEPELLLSEKKFINMLLDTMLYFDFIPKWDEVTLALLQDPFVENALLDDNLAAYHTKSAELYLELSPFEAAEMGRLALHYGKQDVTYSLEDRIDFIDLPFLDVKMNRVHSMAFQEIDGV